LLSSPEKHFDFFPTLDMMYMRQARFLKNYKTYEDYFTYLTDKTNLVFYSYGFCLPNISSALCNCFITKRNYFLAEIWLNRSISSSDVFIKLPITYYRELYEDIKRESQRLLDKVKTDKINHINYYQTLQIDCAAETDVVEGAYKKLAIKYHPDKNKSDDATRIMQELNEAYFVLSDPTRRIEYDKWLGYQNNPSDNPEEVFADSDDENKSSTNASHPSSFVVPKTIEEKFSNKFGWIGVSIGIIVSLLYSLGGRHWIQDFILGLIITIPVGGFLGGIIGHIYGLVKK